MRSAILIIFCLLAFAQSAEAKHYICPAAYEDQEEILINGGVALFSEKEHSILMYQTSDRLFKRKANFYFSIANRSCDPIHLHFSNLRVTDQNGRFVCVISRGRQLARKKREAGGKLFASFLLTTLDAACAADAGRVHYCETTHSKYRSSYGTVTGVTHTHGTVYSPGLQNLAFRNVALDAHLRNCSIADCYNSWEDAIHDSYFESNTVFPDTIYGANLQIEVPRHIERDLEYLIFHFDVDDEEHDFCFWCGKNG